jgi:DNA-binding CsgD family transcriptional regulator
MSAATMLSGVPGAENTRARLLYRCSRLQRYSNPVDGIDNLHVAIQLASAAGDKVLAADARYSCGLLRCFADDWQRGVLEMSAGIDELEALSPEEGSISWSTVNWMADALPMIDLPPGSDSDPAAARLTAAGINHRRGGLPWFLAACGHLGEARSKAEEFHGALSNEGRGPLVLSAYAHSRLGLGIALAALGDPLSARKAFAEAREIYYRLDHHAVIAYSLLTELTDVILPYYASDIDLRSALASEAELALERAGGAFPSGLSQRRAYLALMNLDGRWQEARDIAADSSAHGTYILRRQVSQMLAPIAFHQGQVDEVWGYIRALLPDGPVTEPGSAVLLEAFQMQHLAIDLCLADQDAGKARSWLDANQRWLEWSGAVLGRSEHELGWAKYLHQAGDEAAAETHARLAIDLASEPSQPLALLAAHRLLAEIRLAQDDPVQAKQQIEMALSLADACASPFERAISLITHARIAAIEAPQHARPIASEARTILVRLEARPWIARAETVLAAFEATPPESRPPMGLTSRELDVLRLVAEGLTDSEIGERLYISPRTASQHLRSIYGKLEVHSRAAATRYALEHRIT